MSQPVGRTASIPGSMPERCAHAQCRMEAASRPNLRMCYTAASACILCMGWQPSFRLPALRGVGPFGSAPRGAPWGPYGPKMRYAAGARTRIFALLSLRLPRPGPHMPALTRNSELSGRGTRLAAATSGAADQPGSWGVRAARRPAAAVHRAPTRRPRARFRRLAGCSGTLP